MTALNRGKVYRTVVEVRMVADETGEGESEGGAQKGTLLHESSSS